MSTILDALKKSEQERKLNNIPTLSDMPAPDEGTKVSRAWMLALIVLLAGIALSLLVYIGMQSRQTSDTVSVPVVVDNETIAEQEQKESELAVNVVSYSESAEQRFVIIDGKMARENEFVRPGLKVEKISPDSVILNQRGRRIELRP